MRLTPVSSWEDFVMMPSSNQALSLKQTQMYLKLLTQFFVFIGIGIEHLNWRAVLFLEDIHGCLPLFIPACIVLYCFSNTHTSRKVMTSLNEAGMIARSASAATTDAVSCQNRRGVPMRTAI